MRTKLLLKLIDNIHFNIYQSTWITSDEQLKTWMTEYNRLCKMLPKKHSRALFIIPGSD